MRSKMDKFKPGEKIKTDTFTIRDTKWHFDFYPNGNIARHKGKISIFLVSENEEKVTADCEFSAGRSDHGWFRTLNFSNNEFTPVDNDYGFNAFLCHSMVLENDTRVLQTGKMEFFMKVTVKGEEKTVAKSVPPKNTLVEVVEIEMLRELSNNFEGLLRDEQFANFWIVCGEETFSCHRAVLPLDPPSLEPCSTARWTRASPGKWWWLTCPRTPSGMSSCTSTAAGSRRLTTRPWTCWRPLTGSTCQ